MIIRVKLILIITTILITGCEEILDKEPLSSYSDAIVWSDLTLSEGFLSKIYDGIEAGIGKNEMLGAMSDELIIARGGATSPYNSGSITADRLGTNRGHLNWSHFSNVARINLFLANIDKLPDAHEGSEKVELEEKVQVLRGEAIFLRAWEYHAMMRSYGGLPLISEPFTLGDDFSEIERSTFKETIEFIIKDCDEAASLLNLKSGMEMGRATKEAALALKSRVLLFAASDLTADGSAKSELVGYLNPDRTELWTAAKNAAKVVIDLGTSNLADFGAPDQEAVAQNYFALFKEYDLSNDEIIWGRMYKNNIGTRHRANVICGPNGNGLFGRNGVLQSMVDSYEMKDGTDFFDHFTINDNGEYINISNKYLNENPYYFRDPRFYASILYDSAQWQPRLNNLDHIDPLGIYDRRTRIVIENGVQVSHRFGLDTRNGPVSQNNGTYVGYLLKKFCDDADVITRDDYNQQVWIWLRYAEILLNYAEASLELGEIETATEYINMIRNRSAMPDFTGDIEEALRHERKIELFGEDNRWYDIRRWRILEEVLSPPSYGIDITEITEDGVKTTTWKRIIAQPNNNPMEKLYWIPIHSDELRRAPKLIQNPGY